MSGEAMALNVINIVNNKLKFFHHHSFFTPALRHLLCNALIQPRFEYACSAWYSNLTKKKKMQNSNYSKQVCAFLLVVGQTKIYIS